MFYGRFFGIGNSSAKTDRGNQLGGINADWSVYNQGLPLAGQQKNAGQTSTAAGLSGVDAAKQYFQNIMQGGSAALKAAQPAVSAVNSQADAAMAQAEMGTARGGGINSTEQQLETNKNSQVSNIIAGQQSVAAQETGSLGGTEAQIGNQQLWQALQSLGLDANVAQEIINSSAASRSTSLQANPANGVNASLTSSIGDTLNSALTALGL